jgi:hypothetical protein
MVDIPRKTYPELSALTAPVVDGDVLAAYRSPGPLRRLTASTFADYIKAFFSASGGSALLGFLQSGTGAVARTAQDKMRDFVSVFDFIPVAEQAAIIAGTSTYNATTAINACLAAHKNVWVPAGIYSIASPVLFALQQQKMVFEDGAWFQAATSGTNGIACPHGILDAELINPGLIGVATTQAAGNHTAILWNSNAGGTAPFGSTSTDDMGGVVDGGRFKGSIPGTNGWNSFIHSNMAGGFIARNCVGKGLYGTSTDYGYGHVFSGNNVRSQNNDFDSLITGQGRHAVYMGDQVAGAMVTGLRARRFRKSAIAGNTGTTASNTNIVISDFYLKDVALDADASATNGAIEIAFQGAATSGGSGVVVSNGVIDGVGSTGVYCTGYSQVQINNVLVKDWGTAPGGSYSALKILSCDDVIVSAFQSFSSAANNGGSVIQHVFVQESSRFQLRGGKAVNTGSGAQGSAVTLNATGAGTPDAIIDRFQAVKGSGSWSVAAYVNPTQNGSNTIFPKAGAQVIDTQTGTDITLDATDGQSVFVLNSGATSILQILPAGVGQIVTLRMTGSTQVKQSNVYSPSVFNADANDTNVLICGTAAGASSLWYEISRSSN